jgi:singapore isolate B (sub-type 7) whole genome shotgun sequence assembly, scaffold_7
MGVNEGNERGIEVSEGSVNVSGWEYSFSEDLLVRYGCGLRVGVDGSDNFVKSIRCSPSGYGCIYGSESGMIEYVDMHDVSFWYMGEDVSSVECVELKASREFVHSEVLYGMEWYGMNGLLM